MEITYTQRGDYLFPDLTLEPEEPVTIGKYGQLRRTHLKNRHPGFYWALFLEGKLNQHLLEVDQIAQKRVDRIVEQLLKTNPAPKKEDDPLGWAAHRNMLIAMAEESVLRELVYT